MYSKCGLTLVISVDLNTSWTGFLTRLNRSAQIFSKVPLVTFVEKRGEGRGGKGRGGKRQEGEERRGERGVCCMHKLST